MAEQGGENRTLIARLTEREAREDELNARLSTAPAELPATHPNIADIYARKVARLAESLNQPDERLEAAEAIRSLIEKIVLIPGVKPGELTATLTGKGAPRKGLVPDAKNP